MTREELQGLISDARREAARFGALPRYARVRLEPLAKGIERLMTAARAAELFLTTDPDQEHPFFTSPAIEALPELLAMLAKTIDDAIGRPSRRELN